VSLATLIADAVGFGRHRGSTNGRAGRFPDVSKAPPDIRRQIRDRRYCQVLVNDTSLDEVSVKCAWQALEYEMALVPGGNVRLMDDAAFTTSSGFEFETIPGELIQVAPLWIDRDCITNEDFARFVGSDGYSDPHHWPEEILPNVLQFTDATGEPGPKNWVKGNPPLGKLRHPVVGICWYEANAYATWVGKRLPSTEEWQRAATWGKGNNSDGSEMRFPWGHAFDPEYANTWAAAEEDTVDVDEFPDGATPSGVRHLIGNVWEWVDAQFHPNSESGVSVILDDVMAEIRGGAFDTYFPSQATCQFRSGQSLMYRGLNLGFRCCLGADALPVSPDAINTGVET
jgi:iron(II)-dependent oxidoreductase